MAIIPTNTQKNASLQEQKRVTPQTVQVEVTPDLTYEGLKKVIVEGDANFIPENIAAGVTIWGKTGTHEGGSSVNWLTIVNGVPCLIYDDGED